MRKYKLVVLVKKPDGFEEKMEKLGKALGGRVVKMASMGRKQMAYKIKGVGEADYLDFSLELPQAAVVELEKKLAMDREVVRHLCLRDL